MGLGYVIDTWRAAGSGGDTWAWSWVAGDVQSTDPLSLVELASPEVTEEVEAWRYHPPVIFGSCSTKGKMSA